MLIEFSVENFMSYKDMVTLSMEASYDKSLPENVVESAHGSKFNLLKSAALYGANASGKSNLLRAIVLMGTLVLESAKEMKKGETLGITPFKLDKSFTEKPSSFEIMFFADGVRYQYGFSVSADRIHKEWLYSYPENRRRKFFIRNSGKDTYEYSNIEYSFGPSWSGKAKELVDHTRRDALFISVAALLNHPIAQKVVQWFSEKLRSVDTLPVGESEESFTLNMLRSEKNRKEQILELLNKADFNIVDIQIQAKSLKDKHDFPISIPPEMFEKLIKDLDVDLEKAKFLEVLTFHNGVGEDGKAERFPFTMFEESHGTQKYFALTGPLIHVLEKGCCLIADELDVRLHPALTRSIIELFNNRDINKNGAQLIFATHDTNLLDTNELLRRDQIWFTAKKEDGSTDLYSLWDFKRIRKDENYRKSYLTGRYGAVPYTEPPSYLPMEEGEEEPFEARR